MIVAPKSGLCIGSDSIAIVGSDGSHRTAPASLFIHIDGSVVSGRRAEIAGRIWPKRYFEQPLHYVFAAGCSDSAPPHCLSKHEVISHMVHAALDVLGEMKTAVLAAPYGIMPRFADKVCVGEPWIPFMSRALVAYWWARMHQSSVRGNRCLVVLDSYGDHVEICVGSYLPGDRSSAEMPSHPVMPDYWLHGMWATTDRSCSKLNSFLTAVSIWNGSPFDTWFVGNSTKSGVITDYQAWCKARGVPSRISNPRGPIGYRDIAETGAEISSRGDGVLSFGPLGIEPVSPDLALDEIFKDCVRSVIRRGLRRVPKSASRDLLMLEWRKLQELADGLLPLQLINEDEITALYWLVEKLDMKDPAQVKRLRAMIIRLLLGGRLNAKSVVLISPFSSGKSTLINAMMGYPLLSTDARAETSSVVRVFHAAQPSAIAEYADGVEVCEVSALHGVEEIAALMASARSGPLGRELEGLYLGVPMPEHLRDLELVDTPGYFSRWSKHDSIADAAWVDADVALALIDPLDVGDEHFTEKLKDISEAGKTIIYLVTKRDMYPGDSDEVVEELKLALSDDGANILVVSGYQGLAARLWQTGRISLEELRRDFRVFAIKGEDVIRGRFLMPEHVAMMAQFSNICALEDEILRQAGISGGVE
jgi:hypothetical protein